LLLLTSENIVIEVLTSIINASYAVRSAASATAGLLGFVHTQNFIHHEMAAEKNKIFANKENN